MGLKNDVWIRKMAYEYHMIEPFVDSQVQSEISRVSRFIPTICGSVNNPVISTKKIISYGVSSYGYDMRVARDFKIFTNMHPGIVDPKNFSDNLNCVDFTGDICIVPPNSFALARSVEYFRIPRNVMCICLGKSTYARCGIVVNITALEPEWEGRVTIEISNTMPIPAKIYAEEGIAQVLFFEADEMCGASYLDKKGKYQGQTGITLPKV